jgi:L-aminopeptidase/D-esterase-like protein
MTTALVSPNGFASAAVVHAAAHDARRQAAINAEASRIVNRIVLDNDGYYADWLWDYAFEQAPKNLSKRDAGSYFEEIVNQPRSSRSDEECPF